MHRKRVFKTRTFERWAKKVIADVQLCQAAREIEQGLYEADLGQGICKKRVARPGQGKSGSVRTLVAIQHCAAIFFIVGREKSASGSDFTPREEEAAKTYGSMLRKVTNLEVDELAAGGAPREICNDKEDD